MTSIVTQKPNEIDGIMQELNSAKQICKALMQTPHYAKMGEPGIFAVIQKAKSMGMNPVEALNGGMYFVNGKVEMSGMSMLSLIRQNGHSVSMDAKSTDTKVIMHGKRADNGDSWTVEFGIEDAKKAGIYKNVWEKYPKTMCIWRCVSLLGRFLFGDVIKGVYVQGEISDAPSFDEPVTVLDPTLIMSVDLTPKAEIITDEQANELVTIIEDCSPEYMETVHAFLKKQRLTIYTLPVATYEKLYPVAIKKRDEFSKTLDSVKSETLMEVANV